MSSRRSNYDENSPKDENCRACSDFKTWTHRQSSSRKKAFTITVDRNGITTESTECPLDINELGRSTWSFLHTMAAYYPDKPTTHQMSDMEQFLSSFSNFYPCNHCRNDFKKEIKNNPPTTANRHDLSQWMCDVHNNVNKKLGKRIFDCSKVDERWRYGWKDGSCN